MIKMYYYYASLFMKTKAEIQQYIHRYEKRKKRYDSILKNNYRVLNNLRRELKSYTIREQKFKSLKKSFNKYYGEDVKNTEDIELLSIFCYVCSQYAGLSRFGRKYINFTERKWDYRLKCGKKLIKTTKKEQWQDLKLCIMT